jgi:hypothetical protein
MFPSRTISLVIDRPCPEVYAFLSDPSSLVLWTDGLIHEPLVAAGNWVWTTRHEGRAVAIHFTPPNDFGVLDIRLTSPEFAERHYRVRVFPNDRGSELCCTILQRQGEDDAHFESECEWVRVDLKVLKSYLEAR